MQLIALENIGNAINCTSSVNHNSKPLSEAVTALIRDSIAPNSRRAYRADLAHFHDWGGTLPASETVIAEYLARHAHSHAPATLSRWLASLAKAHRAHGGCHDPTKSELVKATLHGIRRQKGSLQRQACPLLKDDLIAILEHMERAEKQARLKQNEQKDAGEENGYKGHRMREAPFSHRYHHAQSNHDGTACFNDTAVHTPSDDTGTLKACRDRALLLIGFAGGFRRSELVSLNLDDITLHRQGLLITLRRSKTDQTGQGRTIAIPFARGRCCPVKAFEQWVSSASLTQGPLFCPINRHGQPNTTQRLSAEAVSAIIKHYVATIGLDPNLYSGHSLRAGLATSAVLAGASLHKIRAQTGHASDTMLTRYIRDHDLFHNNAAGAVL